MDEVVRAHSEMPWRVGFGGFAPGFAYLVGGDPRLTVARRAEPRTRRVPVVVLTSSQEEKDILSSYDLGANSFVQKPVDYTQFVDTARQLSLYWLELNQSPNR